MVLERYSTNHTLNERPWHRFSPSMNEKNVTMFKTNFLSFNSLISALKSLKANNRNCLLIRNANFESFLSKFLTSHKANKIVYKKLFSFKRQFPFRSQQKWSADCKLESHETLDWQSIYGLSLRCTKITKLITFPIKFLYRRSDNKWFLEENRHQRR